jgi:methionyl-tRNA formyltransferase
LARLILLTEPAFADAVAAPLRAQGADVEVAATLADLARAGTAGDPDCRLISFGSGVIVPSVILEGLAGPAYNFHPGPPQYPGLFPSVFALYDQVTEFGVTLHEMAAKVDSGAIVAAMNFPVPPAWDRLALDTATFGALLRLLEHMAPKLVDVRTPLPRLKQSWQPPRRTRKDFDALCALPENATTEEFARRYRAVGEGPEHALSFTRFGRIFRLESQGEHVVRGGQPVKS